MNHFKVIFLLSMAYVLSGCTTVYSLRSSPPVRAIIITEEFMIGDSTSAMTFPAGKYLPLQEDKRGIYYVAPEKVIVKDPIFTYKYEGGIYWKHDMATPGHLYTNALYGRPLRFLAVLPEYEIEKSDF